VEDRILRQHQLIARLGANGLDTSMAETLLATLQQVLAVMHAHRRLILAEIAGKLPEEDRHPGIRSLARQVSGIVTPVRRSAVG
jgi:hypothetical protein